MNNFLIYLKAMQLFTSTLANSCYENFFFLGQFFWWSSFSERLHVAALLIKDSIANSLLWILINYSEHFLVNVFVLFKAYQGISYGDGIKIVFIRRFFGPYFRAFGLNTEIYSVNLHIYSKCWKMWARKTPNPDVFHVVDTSLLHFDRCLVQTSTNRKCVAYKTNKKRSL